MIQMEMGLLMNVRETHEVQFQVLLVVMEKLKVQKHAIIRRVEELSENICTNIRQTNEKHVTHQHVKLLKMMNMTVAEIETIVQSYV